MLYLVLEILPMLLLAALCGAAFTYWWTRRHYEDVTLSHERLIADREAAKTDHWTQADLEKKLDDLHTAIIAAKPAETDLSPVANRLSALEAALSGIAGRTSELKNTDTTPLLHKLDTISGALSQQTGPDLAPVEAKLEMLETVIKETRISETELGPIHSGLTRLELALGNLNIPTPDFKPDFLSVRNEIGALSERLEAVNTDKTADMQGRLTELSAAVAELKMPDMAPLNERISELQAQIGQIHIPLTDMSPIDEGLSLVHGRLASLETSLMDQLQSAPQEDNTLVEQGLEQVKFEISRLERMEGSIGALRQEVHHGRPDMDSVHQRIAHLQSQLEAQPVQDFAPALNAIYSMEQRLAILHADLDKQPGADNSQVINSIHALERQFDITALENRLTSIEYGLAALHHALRNRPEAGPSLRTPEPAPPAQPAPPPPIFVAPPPPMQEPAFRSPPPAYTPPESFAEPTPMPPAFTPPPEPAFAAPSRDMISEARRPGDEANLLSRPAFGAPDDLEDVSGIGPMLHDLLTEIGVYYFWQIAEWSPREIEWVDDMLDGFNGRIERDDWVGQARILATRADAAQRP